MFDRMVTDPGPLVLVKSLPRKDYTPSPGGAGPRSPRPAGNPSGTGAAAETEKKKLEQEWWDASKKMVYAWCGRFHAAATAKEEASTDADEKPKDAAAPTFPGDFTLGPDAKVTAEYHVVWPDKAPPQCAELKLGLLEIHYVYAEESGKLKKLKGFYSRKAKARVADLRTTDKGIWIDSNQRDTQEDRRRSLDVLISRSAQTRPSPHLPVPAAQGRRRRSGFHH